RSKPLDLREDAPPLSREQFAAEFGADPADVERVQAFARDHDLTVGGVDLARRSIELAGSIAAMNEAFGTELKLFLGEEGSFRGRTGELFIPVELQESVVGVYGLDNRPQARSHCRRQRIVAGPRAAG